jgi:hypothetical protein
MKTFEPWVAVGQGGGSAPAPGLVVTNGGTATCDSGSADDPGSAVAVRCSPPGNGTPCYINDTGGGDPGSPLLCSSDPTSRQVIEVTPAGIPAGLLNPGDPRQPPWFLVLADGRKCHLLGYGTNTNVLGYDCGNSIGATVPDRSAPTWTVQEGQLQADPALSPARVAVVTAYRGKTPFPSGSAPSASPSTPPTTPISPSAPPPIPGTRACAFNTPAMWSPLCPDGTGDMHFTPWQVVYFYYAYVNAGDYPDAWALMSPGWQATEGGYDRWEAGYAGANNGHVSEISPQGDIVNVAVTLPGKCFTGDYQVDNNKITAAHVTTCT